MKRIFTIITLLAILGLVLGGCATPEQRAQKLFDQGKYEEILTKYKDLPIAAQAKAKVAEQMLAEGKYQEILDNYADTPSVAEATNKLAEGLVNEKKFNDVLAKYPNTPAANVARQALAEQLYAEKKFDELVMKYPNTPAGMKARTEAAADEWKKIEKLAKAKKKTAIEEFLKNPKFAGTESAMKAQQELAKINAPAPAKKK